MQICFIRTCATITKEYNMQTERTKLPTITFNKAFGQQKCISNLIVKKLGGHDVQGNCWVPNLVKKGNWSPSCVIRIFEETTSRIVHGLEAWNEAGCFAASFD